VLRPSDMVSSFFSRLDGDEDLSQSPVGVEVHGRRGRGVGSG
jgi:hypothetical protein